MAREQVLKHIEEVQKSIKEVYPNSAVSVLEFYQDLADYHGLSLEQLTEKMMILGGVGFTRPIRAKNYKESKHTSYTYCRKTGELKWRKD